MREFKNFVFKLDELQPNSIYTYEGNAIRITSKTERTLSMKVVGANGMMNDLHDVTIEEVKNFFGIYEANEPIKHERFNVLKAFLEADQNIYLVGPAGTGKNHTCLQLANELGLNFYFSNGVQFKHDVTGYGDANGRFIETPFYKAWANGGLFMLDEFDSSCADAAIVLNAALANGYFDFPVVGNVQRHPNFRVIAAGNTCGTGANDEYTARQTLDAATLDRFWVVDFGYDPRVEERIAKGDRQILDFIRGCRSVANEMNIRGLICGYRVIDRFATMKGKLTPVQLVQMGFIKGLGSDLCAELYTELFCKGLADNPYVEALKVLSKTK